MNTASQPITFIEMCERVREDYYRCKVPIREYPRNDPDKSSRWQNITMSQLSLADYDLYKAQKQEFQNDMAQYEADLATYRQQQTRLEQEFWHDAAVACGVANHPKLSNLQYLAYEFGHSYGYGEIWRYFNEMAELLKD